jgi:hypothetical protein
MKSRKSDARLNIFMGMKTRVVVLWVMTPYDVVVGYQHFVGLYFSLKLRQHGPSKRWNNITTSLHDVTTQKNTIQNMSSTLYDIPITFVTKTYQVS